MAKKIFKHIIVGLAIGFVCTTACLWIFRAYEAGGIFVMRQFTMWLLASAMYGVISLIYDTSVPFPLSLILHFTGCLAITFAGGVLSGFMEVLTWKEWFISVIPGFVIIYLIIGIAITLVSKYNAKKINKKIGKE